MHFQFHAFIAEAHTVYDIIFIYQVGKPGLISNSQLMHSLLPHLQFLHALLGNSSLHISWSIHFIPDWPLF